MNSKGLNLRSLAAGVVAGAMLTATPTQAAMPVVDVASIEQLLAQIEYWKQQIEGMTAQLTQLQETYAAFTGPRGMEQVLALTPADRNYLPEAFGTIREVLDGIRDREGSLGPNVLARLEAHAILDDERVESLGPAVAALIERARRGAAWSEVVGESAYTAAGIRFRSLQDLVTTIAEAGDPKAIADLSARIQAEQVMLENESAKLNSIAQTARAMERSEQLAVREQVVAAHGVFGARFQPTPP